ncbi:hypothetical protein EV424DRAFT_214501 [Suillus variegatus]|nr:hypothetical protein EV424DRAFT_214501 [Suillus variegatus]
MNSVLSMYEGCVIPPLRRAALTRAYHLIVLEDENTKYQALGPVSKMMNLICRAHVEGPNSFDFPKWTLTTENIYPFGGESLRWRISLAISGHLGSSPGNCSSLCTGSTWTSGGYTVMSNMSTSLSLNAGNCRCPSRTRNSTSLAIPEISLVSKPAMT